MLEANFSKKITLPYLGKGVGNEAWSEKYHLVNTVHRLHIAILSELYLSPPSNLKVEYRLLKTYKTKENIFFISCLLVNNCLYCQSVTAASFFQNKGLRDNVSKRILWVHHIIINKCVFTHILCNTSHKNQQIKEPKRSTSTSPQSVGC